MVENSRARVPTAERSTSSYMRQCDQLLHDDRDLSLDKMRNHPFITKFIDMRCRN